MSLYVSHLSESSGFENGSTTYGMALAQGLDVQEGQRLVALEELERGDLSYILSGCTC